jgi:hypothetical protein
VVAIADKCFWFKFLYVYSVFFQYLIHSSNASLVVANKMNAEKVMQISCLAILHATNISSQQLFHTFQDVLSYTTWKRKQR